MKNGGSRCVIPRATWRSEEDAMRTRRLVVGVGTLIALTVVAPTVAEAGQASGSRNCGSSFIYTYGDGYGNQVHLVGALGQQWSHALGTRAQHYYYSGYNNSTWSVTTGGALITGTSNCYG